MPLNFLDIYEGELAVGSEMGSAGSCLSDLEKQKAEALNGPALRDRYIRSRILLRQTLASYLSVAPADLQFAVGEFGKPRLHDDGLYFNLSHTANRLLIAVSDMPDIGVDIESVNTRRHLDGLARRCFSDVEYREWLGLAVDQRLKAFYRLWTKKEALVKAIGRGIALGIERCEFALDIGGALLAVPDEFGPVSRWCVQELEVETGFNAAVVTPNRPHSLRRLSMANV